MLTANKSLHFYIGRLGSGKTHLAKQYANSLAQNFNLNPVFIDVSDVMRGFAGIKATREQLQEFKALMKAQPRFLVDKLRNMINQATTNDVVIAGLRELWIYKELVATYNLRQVVLVEANPQLRCKRRNLTAEVFLQQESKDKSLGIDDLIEYVKSNATIVNNEFELNNVDDSLDHFDSHMAQLRASKFPKE